MRRRRTFGRPRLRSLAWRAGLAMLVATAAGAAWADRAARLGPSVLPEPTRIYARPLVLRPDDVLRPGELEETLRQLGYRRVARRAAGTGEYGAADGRWTIGRRPFRHPGGFEPGGTIEISLDRRGRIARVRDADGRALRAAALEPELLRTRAENGEDRLRVPLEDVPEHLVAAVLAVEDQRFLEHRGIDARRIAGALLANLRAGRFAQGGSTLTQQLARSLYLSRERTLFRKAREAGLALALERRYGKREILHAYLNEVYLGQDGALAVHGVGRAALHYFDKDVSRLDVAESALLAGLIRGPSLYEPRRHPERARARRDFVLRLLADQGALGARELERALAADLGVREAPRARSPTGPWAADFTERFLGRRGVRAGAGQDGIAIFTSVDARVQRAAEAAVRRRLADLEARRPALRRPEAPLQAAVVALDPWSGEVLAMVGGRDYARSQLNRAADARRQPGSVFKPVVALAALRARDDGRSPFTLASTLEDEPLDVRTSSGAWRPANYDGLFRGPVTLRRALEESLNVPIARLGLAVGPERIAETARALGIEGPLAPVPSLALGSSEVSLLEIVRAYGALAAEGTRAPLRPALAVVGAGGARLDREPDPPARAVRPEEAYLVTSALRGAVERGTAHGLRALGYAGPVAGKTGTTNGFRDAWFVAYTPELVVGAWVGFDDGRGLGLPGSAAALPIVADVLRAALGPDGRGGFRIPGGLEWAAVDPVTGLLAGPGCPGDVEPFLAGTAPRESCTPYRFVDAWLSGRGRTDRWLEAPGGLERLRRDAARALEDAAEWIERLRRELEGERRRGRRR